MPLQISEKVMALAAQAQAGLRDQFDRIDSIAEENTRKVLAAFQKHRVAEAYFAGTTGYGYDDLGRDKLDGIFAELFGTEDALVRVQFVNGTHAISCALFGALKPGDILVSAVGAPYDTMLGVIGVVDKGPGSLKSYGIEYRQVDLLDDAPDPEGLARAVRDPRVKAVLIQRSKGYSTRSSLSVAEIGALCQVVRANNPEAAILVDNCYGECVETLEPTQAGADLVVGSLRRLYCRTAGFGGGGRHAADHPRYRKGVRLHLWGQPQPLSRTFPCPPYHGPGSQDGGVCRPDDGAAGLPDGAHLRYGTPRHHSDDPLRRAGAPQKILQRHPVRRAGGLLRNAGALGHAGL